ncbi:Rieske 2Fe-2S domain-containing protein [Aerosakkonema funiforme]
MENKNSDKNRREFLKYMVFGTAGTVALGWMLPEKSLSHERRNTTTPCTQNRNSEACQNYLRGVPALDSNGKHLQESTLLASAVAGRPVLVQGLPRATYLVINEGPKLAGYAINPSCPHHKCTVEWKTEKNVFVCPCHGATFDAQGKVTKGPARRNLPLITVLVQEDDVLLVDRAPATDPRR